MSGGTSGRFYMVRKIARLFPEHMDFTRQVIAEGIEPASAFPTGPYPGDKLTYRSKNFVDYVTPPHTKGLDTESRLQPNGESITSFVLVSVVTDEDTDAISLELRFPPNLASLAPICSTRDRAEPY